MGTTPIDGLTGLADALVAAPAAQTGAVLGTGGRVAAVQHGAAAVGATVVLHRQRRVGRVTHSYVLSVMGEGAAELCTSAFCRVMVMVRYRKQVTGQTFCL